MRSFVRVQGGLAALLVFCFTHSDSFGFVNDLRARGYSLIPAPQRIELRQGDFEVDRTWGIDSRAGGSRAAESLRRGAAGLHGLDFSGTGAAKVVLEVVPGTVKGSEDPALNGQGYRLAMGPEGISIKGNSDQGLFYGVQSLLQLMRRTAPGRCTLPGGTIIDWPDLELRFIHWDTKHHQDRPETLKRYLDQAAFFKVNAIGFEIEDKYEYPRHPVIGAPGAFTRAEMQELTAYALERFIQLVPVVQAPAHLAYVLKHPEFAHLRADGSNYQACMCDEEAIALILDMYQDMIDATPGVKYFHVSTDEVYYAGTCEKCRKKRPYNVENRSRTWAEYASRVHAWLAERGRRMLAWVEYPLLGKDIPMLAPDIINGIMGREPEYLAFQKKIGMRQLAYSSMQGAELLFPNFFSTTYRGRSTSGRLQDAMNTVPAGLAAGADPIGTFAAAWDDSGLHDETFWLGWATVTQYGWTVGKPALDQSVADFMDVFYGPDSPDMVEVYRLLIEGARFYEDLWDQVVSKERGPGYGNSRGKGIGTTRHDLTLDTPALPGPGSLELERSFSARYREKLDRAAAIEPGNERLVQLLNRNLSRVSRNRYNLEALLSIAYLEKYAIHTALALERVEDYLARAAERAAGNEPAAAVAALVEAYNLAGQVLEKGKWVMDELTRVWEKSRYEKCRSVGGRNFVHVLDDVKDHFADRRPGLDYMSAPFQRMDLEGWRVKLGERLREYAAANNVPVEGMKEARLED
ncbi:MAG: beta-N-acetylhexosaminidase [Candidatus Glassbacteria bacterium]|nr:beta-N-acetylhexosaminidase [Candidatus Glassbacteria bacterium]